MPDNSNIDLDTLESRLQTAEADEGLMRQYVEATSQLDAERGKKFLVQLLKTPSAALACFGLAMQAKRRRDQTMLQIWAIEAIQRDPQHRLGLSLFDEKNAASLEQYASLIRDWNQRIDEAKSKYASAPPLDLLQEMTRTAAKLTLHHRLQRYCFNWHAASKDVELARWLYDRLVDKRGRIKKLHFLFANVLRACGETTEALQQILIHLTQNAERDAVEWATSLIAECQLEQEAREEIAQLFQQGKKSEALAQVLESLGGEAQSETEVIASLWSHAEQARSAAQYGEVAEHCQQEGMEALALEAATRALTIQSRSQWQSSLTQIVSATSVTGARALLESGQVSEARDLAAQRIRQTKDTREVVALVELLKLWRVADLGWPEGEERTAVLARWLVQSANPAELPSSIPASMQAVRWAARIALFEGRYRDALDLLPDSDEALLARVGADQNEVFSGQTSLAEEIDQHLGQLPLPAWLPMQTLNLSPALQSIAESAEQAIHAEDYTTVAALCQLLGGRAGLHNEMVARLRLHQIVRAEAIWDQLKDGEDDYASRWTDIFFRFLQNEHQEVRARTEEMLQRWPTNRALRLLAATLAAKTGDHLRAVELIRGSVERPCRGWKLAALCLREAGDAEGMTQFLDEQLTLYREGLFPELLDDLDQFGPVRKIKGPVTASMVKECLDAQDIPSATDLAREMMMSETSPENRARVVALMRAYASEVPRSHWVIPGSEGEALANTLCDETQIDNSKTLSLAQRLALTEDNPERARQLYGDQISLASGLAHFSVLGFDVIERLPSLESAIEQSLKTLSTPGLRKPPHASPGSRHMKAFQLSQKGEHAKAADLLSQEKLTNGPDKHILAFNKVASLMWAERLDEAEKLLRNRSQEFDPLESAWLLTIIALKLRGRSDALKEIRALIKEAPTFRRAYYPAAGLLASEGEWTEAIEVLQKHLPKSITGTLMLVLYLHCAIEVENREVLCDGFARAYRMLRLADALPESELKLLQFPKQSEPAPARLSPVQIQRRQISGSLEDPELFLYEERGQHLLLLLDSRPQGSNGAVDQMPRRKLMSLLSQLWTEHDRLEWEPETWLDRIHQALQDQNEEHEAEQEPLYCAAAACTINLEGSTCSAAQVGGARIYIETEEGFAPIFDEESLMPLGSGEYEIQARSSTVLQGRILLATEGAVQILESQNGQFIDGPLPLEVTDEFSEREISSNVGDATLVVFRPPTV